ncbi:MAG: hypothetical protein V5804_03270 [Mucilaginibacter sp.]|uniref:hypothetical protein n=1 Tax=Mucilaginibacter sp. TaxID=1882438 RepID=UPI0034E5DCAA
MMAGEWFFGMTKTHQIYAGKRSIAFSHPEIFSGSLFRDHNLSDEMPKKFRHDKKPKHTNFWVVKEALALVILKSFQDPSSK